MLANSATYASPAPPRSTPWLVRVGPVLLCALSGVLSVFTIALGGQMPVGELILLAVFPWILVRFSFRRGWPARLQQLGWFRLLLLLAAFTALGYVASDLYRGTAFNNLARGWARVGFLVIDLVAIAYLVDRSWSRWVVFLLSLQLSFVLHAFIAGPLYGDWWKFGVGGPLTIAVLFAVAGRAWPLQIAAAALLGAVSIFLGARSLGAISLIVAGLLACQAARGLWRPIAFLTSLGTVAALLFVANTFVLSQQDHAGSNLERRSMVESATELFISSPLLGQGSWFIASSRIEHLETKRAAIDDSFRRYTAEEVQKLSLHSQILTALAEAGLLGGTFFFGLAALLLKTFRTVLRHSTPYRALLLYFVLTGAWNLLMNPFSGVARVEIVLAVCACLLVILQRQGELPEDYRE